MRRATRRFAPVLAAIAVTHGATADAVQETTRVSVDSAGVESNDRSLLPSLSADGRFVVFTSDADDLVANDLNGVSDVFIHDRVTGTTERVSVDSTGNEADGWSFAHFRQAISGDGTLVVFGSAATNFDPNDQNGCYDVFVRDLRSGTTQLVSVDSSGLAGNSNSGGPVISADGRCVAFESDANNLVANDNNKHRDIFLRDLASGTTERISVDSAGKEGNGVGIDPALSADGRFVAFESTSSNLVANDTNRWADVFVRDRQSGTTERVSVATSGAQANHVSDWLSISADGSLVVFQSYATNLVSGDLNLDSDVFVRDRALGTTTRVSVDSAGAEGDGYSGAASIDPEGRYVAFKSSASNLVAGDTNQSADVFVRDLATGTTVRRSVDSTGSQVGGTSLDPAITAGGRVVAFESYASDLVAADTNGVLDVFVHDLCGAVATWTNYGAGYPGTYGVPSLTSQQFPSLGATITIDLSNSYAQPTIGFFVLGLQRASLPTKWGGDLLVLPAVIQPITFSYGGDSFTGTIPDDVALCGVSIDLQGIEADPGAAYGVSFSQGLELVIGS
jgi:Tol biopolymer transport system component